MKHEDEPLNVPGDFATFFLAAGYSRRYGTEIDRLKQWFSERLPDPLPEISPAQREVGTGAVDWAAELSREAFEQWRRDRGYELSYNQTCLAFFAAYDAAKGAGR